MTSTQQKGDSPFEQRWKNALKTDEFTSLGGGATRDRMFELDQIHTLMDCNKPMSVAEIAETFGESVAFLGKVMDKPMPPNGAMANTMRIHALLANPEYVASVLEQSTGWFEHA